MSVQVSQREAPCQARTVSIRHSTWLSGFLVGVVIAFCTLTDARAAGPNVPAAESGKIPAAVRG